MNSDNPQFSKRYHEAADKIAENVDQKRVARRKLRSQQERLQTTIQPLAEKRIHLGILADVLTREGKKLEDGTEGTIPQKIKRQEHLARAIEKKTKDLGLNNTTIIRASTAALKKLQEEQKSLQRELANLQYKKSLNEKNSKDNTQEILTINKQLKSKILRIIEISKQLNLPLNQDEEHSYNQILRDIENHEYNPITIPEPRKTGTRKNLFFTELLDELDTPGLLKAQAATSSDSEPTSPPQQDDNDNLFERLLADLDHTNTPPTAQVSASSALKPTPTQSSETPEDDPEDLLAVLQSYYAINASSKPKANQPSQINNKSRLIRQALVNAVAIIKQDEHKQETDNNYSPAQQLTEPVKPLQDSRRSRKL